MTSVLTNNSALSALQSLTATQRQLTTTQNQISSGLSVANASDSEVYWSIGKTMSAQVAGLSAVQQGLSVTKSVADVTATALVSIKASLDRMQADVVAAQQSGVSLSAVQADISAQQQSIIAVANSASFNGVNWLINKISSSQKTVTDLDIDVSKGNYQAILLGQQLGASHFESTININNTTTANGTTYTSTRSLGYLVTTTVLSVGSVNSVSVAKPITTSGDTGLLSPGYLNVPVADSATAGVVTSPFALAPLTLFSDYTGKVEDIQNTYFGPLHQEDPAYSHHITSTTLTTHSYDGYGGGGSPGLLDVGFTVSGGSTGGSGSGPAPGQQGGASQSTLSLGIAGGAVDTGTSSSGGGGAGSTSNTIQESILTMNVVGASAADLAVMGMGLQTAITGIIAASTDVGALQTRITTISTFDASLSDALTSGIGSLVDADMNLASTRLQALRIQQQLGVQILSMANNNSQLILKLFQAA